MKSLLDLLRGFLIGTAEVIPGVSGGTIALVVGLYDRIVRSVAEAIKGLATSFRGAKSRFGLNHFANVEFGMLIPLGIGMVFALVIGSAALEPLLATQPELMRALFAGMIAASLIVPIRMVGTWKSIHILIFSLGAVFAFGLTSLERVSAQQPSYPWVFIAAALAVCALVLPGVSGSFLLLALGMYQPTIAAINDRDFAYLGVFLLGAIAGLASFAMLLQWLLSNHRALTMSAMSGLMLGSLRALWPWQSETGQLLSASEPTFPLLGFALGMCAVAIMIFVEGRLKQKSQ